jgi:hypothetical protein
MVSRIVDWRPLFTSKGILLPFFGDIILGVQLYGLAIIRDGFFMLAIKVIETASIDIGTSILRV